MWHAIWFSIWESGLTVLLSLLIGGGLAVLEHAWKTASPKWFQILMTIPVFLPPAIVAVGFITVFGQTGYINTVLQWLHLPTLHILYSPTAIILSHCFFNIPLAYLAVALRLRTISHTLSHMIQLCGASHWQAWWIAVWPRLRSAVFGVSVIIFLYSFMSFALPLILGGVRYQTLEVYIYTLITQQFDFTTASWLALGQWLGLSCVIILSYKQLTTISEQQLYQSTGTNKLITTLRFILGFCILLPALSLVMDGMLIPHSFVRLTTTQFWSAWVRSISLAVIVTILTLVISTVSTIHFPRLTKLAALFLAISPVTLGLAVLLTLGKSLVTLIIAYTISLMPLIGYLLSNQWQTRPHLFTATLQLLGANCWQRYRLNCSWLRSSLIQAAGLSMTFVLGDITLAGLLAPYRQPLAMSVAAGYISSYHFNLATAGMVVVLGTIALVIMVLHYAHH